jgi:glutamyl/glutaminyl-tRNA synthetase
MLTRLAPTPSGYLHTGNIYNFLLNWLWAKSNQGKVLLRIDDGDAERKRKVYVEDIFRVLDWLGLDWDIGPSGPDDFEKNWSQHRRKEMYEESLLQLVNAAMLFACTCSRKDVCHCVEKNIPLSQAGTAWKIKTNENTVVSFHDKILKETAIPIYPFVVRKKDGFAAYQLCSVADDRYFGITHICRGADLQESTAMQLYLDDALSSPFFRHCILWHHPLIENTKGIKLSKSAGALGESIVNTISKEKILSDFCRWMGWREEGLSLHEMRGLPVFIYT